MRATSSKAPGASTIRSRRNYYQSILRRAPDRRRAARTADSEAGPAERVLGANVPPHETYVFALASAFFNSVRGPRVFNRTAFGGMSRDLYATFSHRAADSAGLSYWTGLICGWACQRGGGPSSPFHVLRGVFRELHGRTSFGKHRLVRAEIDTVVDFYRGILASLPDSDGFNFLGRSLPHGPSARDPRPSTPRVEAIFERLQWEAPNTRPQPQQCDI
jgi:hypothetical protein